jgi:hypothetical protein
MEQAAWTRSLPQPWRYDLPNGGPPSDTPGRPSPDGPRWPDAPLPLLAGRSGRSAGGTPCCSPCPHTGSSWDPWEAAPGRTPPTRRGALVDSRDPTTDSAPAVTRYTAARCVHHRPRCPKWSSPGDAHTGLNCCGSLDELSGAALPGVGRSDRCAVQNEAAQVNHGRSGLSCAEPLTGALRCRTAGQVTVTEAPAQPAGPLGQHSRNPPATRSA